MNQIDFTITPFNSSEPIKEVIRIAKGEISSTLAAYKFQDKDTNQIVVYLPSVEVSGYGDDYQQAEQMAKSSIIDYFAFLLTLKSDEIKIELAKCGWKQRMFHNKEYSKSFVDINGELKNFNAVEGSVQALSLVTA